MTCTQCHRTMHGSARHPVCITCRSSRTCSDCPAPISWRSKGRCQACANRLLRADPVIAARHAAATAAYNSDPANAAIRRAAARKAAMTKRADPATVEKMREAGRRYGAPNIEATRSPEVRAKAGRAISATKQAQRRVRLAWLPPSREDEYRRLSIMFSVAEAKRMILADLTPHERNLARIAAGARLVDKPLFHRGDHAMTLGGVASGLL